MCPNSKVNMRNFQLECNKGQKVWYKGLSTKKKEWEEILGEKDHPFL